MYSGGVEDFLSVADCECAEFGDGCGVIGSALDDACVVAVDYSAVGVIEDCECDSAVYCVVWYEDGCPSVE